MYKKQYMDNNMSSLPHASNNEEHGRRSSGRISDPFDDALNIIVSAKEAADQARKANEKAEAIERLAQRAHQHAASLAHMATHLKHTAASVAQSALRICGHESFQQAYDIHPEYSNILNLDDLLNTIDLYGQQHIKSHQSKGVVLKSPNRSAVSLPDRDRGVSFSPQLGSRGLDEEDDDGRSDSFNKIRRNTPAVTGMNKHVMELDESTSAIKVNIRRDTFKPIKPDEDILFDRTADDRDCLTERRYDETRLIASPAHSKLKLAKSFESFHDIPTLKEDSYMDEPETTCESYSDKKAMRQFQIKLQKSREDINRTSPESFTLGGPPRILTRPRSRSLGADSEVESIMFKPKPLELVQSQETTHKGIDLKLVQNYSEKKDQRSVSPLLSHTERGQYKVSAERSPSLSPRPQNTPKHQFKPDISSDTK